MRGAFLRYRLMAYVTGVVLAVAFVWLVLGRLFWGYEDAAVRPALYGYLWIGHGWLYFLYLVAGVDLAFRVRYSVLKTLAILVAGTVPFMSFVAERLVHRDISARGLLDLPPPAPQTRRP